MQPTSTCATILFIGGWRLFDKGNARSRSSQATGYLVTKVTKAGFSWTEHKVSRQLGNPVALHLFKRLTVACAVLCTKYAPINTPDPSLSGVASLQSLASQNAHINLFRCLNANHWTRRILFCSWPPWTGSRPRSRAGGARQLKGSSRWDNTTCRICRAISSS